jgi:transcriptional regulator with XRE-family HTH domain
MGMKPWKLKQVRERLKLTQAELAARLGVTPNSVARWERGEMNMRPAIARLIELVAQETDLTRPRRAKDTQP